MLACSDLYALGATLAEALTGQSPNQLRGKGLRLAVADHATVSPEFAEWLQQMLAPNLEHRWRSAQDALEALGQVA